MATRGAGQFLRNFVRERFLYARTIGNHIARKIVEFAMVGEVLSAEKLYITTLSLGKDIPEMDALVISNELLKWILALARQAAGPREETSNEDLNKLQLDPPADQVLDTQVKQRLYHLTQKYELEKAAIDKFLQKDVASDQHVNAETGFSAMKTSQALLAATSIAFAIGEAEKGEELLTRMAQRINANQNFEYMQLIRPAWNYFARGWLREQLNIDKAKLEVYCEEVHRIVDERLRGGRRQLSDFYASYGMRELLAEVDQNTIAFGNRNPNLFDEWDEEEPPATYLRPPAQEDEISNIETKINMKLPAELKEALLISNGTEPTRSYLDLRFQAFGGLDSYEMHERPDVDEDEYDYNSQIRPWEEVQLFDDQLRSADMPETEDDDSQETIRELEGVEEALRISPAWPKLARAMTLNWCHQDINGENLYLLEPSLVSEAKTTFDQFYKRIQEGNNTVLERKLDRLIQDYFGGKERFDRMEWGVMEIGMESPNYRFWPSVRDWLSEVVWSSKDWEAKDTSPLPKPEEEEENDENDDLVAASRESSQTVREDSEGARSEHGEQPQKSSAGESQNVEEGVASRKRTRDEAGFEDAEEKETEQSS